METGYTYVSGVGSDNGEVVFVDDLLHLLHASQISQHISNGDDVTIGDELLSDLFGSSYGTGSDGLRSGPSNNATCLFDEVSCFWEQFNEVQLEIGSFRRSSSIGRGASDDNGTEISTGWTLVHTRVACS